MNLFFDTQVLLFFQHSHMNTIIATKHSSFDTKHLFAQNEEVSSITI